jgi:hypothetical protein
LPFPVFRLFGQKVTGSFDPHNVHEVLEKLVGQIKRGVRAVDQGKVNFEGNLQLKIP